MKHLVVAAIFLFPVVVMIFFMPKRGTLPIASPTEASGNKTLADRLQQYGAQARARVKPSFDAQKISYPPARLVFVGLKEEKILEIYAAGTNGNLQLIRSYPILAASGGAGPKLREGDQQVPEGVYRVESLNPNSKYHLSLRVNYPNEFDREQAKLENRGNLGGDIMIHGSNVSIGCLAMGDEAAEDLFVLAADTGVANIAIILSPVDFRKGKAGPSLEKMPRWTGQLYESIKTKLAELAPPR